MDASQFSLKLLFFVFSNGSFLRLTRLHDHALVRDLLSVWVLRLLQIVRAFVLLCPS